MISAPVDVWCVEIPRLARLERRFDAVLDDEERDRAGRLVRPDDALSYRVAHGALRTILGARVGAPPQRISFTVGAHGKPRLRDGGPCFSLSHSGELALVAVSSDREVGVDVEAVRPVPAAEALARRFFSPAEARTIADQPANDRDVQFMRSWTAMEAVLKAEGTGLAARSRPDPRWSVRRLDLAPAYVGAVATRGGDFAVRMRHFESTLDADVLGSAGL